MRDLDVWPGCSSVPPKANLSSVVKYLTIGDARIRKLQLSYFRLEIADRVPLFSRTKLTLRAD